MAKGEVKKMGQILLAILLLLAFCAFNTAAQTKFEKRTFDDGVKLARDGAFAEARSKFDALADVKATDAFRAKVNYNRGVCAFRTGDAASAVKFYEAAVALDDGYERAFYALGMARVALKDFANAEKAFLKALRLDDRNGETWFDLAFVFLASEKYDDAKLAFEKAVANKSKASDYAHNNLGVLHAMRGDVEAAKTEFRTAIRLSGGRAVEAKENLATVSSYAFRATAWRNLKVLA